MYCSLPKAQQHLSRQTDFLSFAPWDEQFRGLVARGPSWPRPGGEPREPCTTLLGWAEQRGAWHGDPGQGLGTGTFLILIRQCRLMHF